jgi:uncharacterized SAM-binding protein YcdF (DUF218 family)
MPLVFVFLSKLLDWLLEPLSWTLLLLVAAALLRGRGRLAGGLAALGVAMLVAFSMHPVSDAIMRATERGARSTFREDVVYDAVVVLGGMVDDAASRASGETELRGQVDRLVRGFELARAGRARHVVVSAGLISPQPGDIAEGARLAEKLAAWGIPEDRIVAETASRNTRENAVEVSRIAAARGWRTLLVVTSAAHLPRAQGCFRAVGLDPDVLPVDFRGGDGRGRSYLPRAGALAKSTDALRELAGRVVYRVAGYTR